MRRFHSFICLSLSLTKKIRNFISSGFYEDAIGYLEQQLGTLERVNSSTAQLDRARALGHLADCYDALNDFEEGNSFDFSY